MTADNSDDIRKEYLLTTYPAYYRHLSLHDSVISGHKHWHVWTNSLFVLLHPVLEISGLLACYTMSWSSGIRIPARKIYFSLLQNVQTRSEAQPAFYTMRTRGWSGGVWVWPSPPSNSRVTNVLCCESPLYIYTFTVCTGSKHLNLPLWLC
jgi:hypothetical protein